MTDNERTPAPRRSTREKKPAQYFGRDVNVTPTKRKRRQDEGVGGEEDGSDAALGDGEDGGESSAEDDYVAPKKKRVSVKGKGKSRGGAPAAPRKPRATKNTTKTPTRKPRKLNGVSNKSTSKNSSDAKITNDNALFNAIMNPNAALQSVVEDLLESFTQTPNAALADIINCILRCCGSNDSVDADRAVDHDGIVDALDDFTEILKEDDAPTYPLTSKLPIFKKFRKSLSEFLTRLIESAAELGTLYTSELLTTIQAWVVAMSSSQLRSFRHTATVIALDIETALCEVAAAVEKEAEVIARQREGERKRKAKGAGSGRDKELENKAAEVKGRRANLAEYLKDVFDGVFVHRYRDLDPNIRADCVHSLGEWLRKFPAHFLSGDYLRYIGWVLSDSNTHVRLESVKSLVSLYTKEDYIVSLHSFTERFKPRLIEMATSDTELSVRVAVIQVLSAIDGHGLLEENQRAQLCLLVFDADAKVRKAVSNFVRGVWEETTEQRLVAKNKLTDNERDRAGLKALAMLLLRWSRELDRDNVDETEGGNDAESSTQGDGPSSQREVAVAMSPLQKGRIALAVEALWDEVPAVSDWEAMIDLLLLDHSARIGATNGEAPVTRRKKTKKPTDDMAVDEAWRLEESEEALLLEVLVASMRKSKLEAVGGKKGEEENVASEITRALTKCLPEFFAKHQTDEHRISVVLLMPEVMNLDIYLEMRMVTAYEALWDDVNKQFLTHSSPTVLAHSISAIRHLMSTTSLSNTNGTKILELEDDLASSLRDVVGGRDELEVATFSDDEATNLGAVCARIAALAGVRDLTAWMEEDEGGKQSSAWVIVSALAERGSLGYKEEENMVDRALHLLTLHVIWKARNLVHIATEEESHRETLREQRDSLLEKLTEYAIGTQSNTLLSIKRAAFQNLMTLHILFASSAEEDAEGKPLPLSSLALSLSDELQYRCAGFVQAEIERYAEELEESKPRPEGSDAESSLSSDSELGDLPSLSNTKKPPPAKKGKEKKKAGDEVEEYLPSSRAKLEQEYIFNTTMATFLRAIRAGCIHVRHAVTLLTHYGRLGQAFDLTAKLVVDILREEGMFKDNGDIVVEVVTRALQESHTLLLHRMVDSEQHTIVLAKLLTTCIVVRGAQLTVVRRLPSEFVVEIHTTLVSWIFKEIAKYEQLKNKRSRANAILFFRAMCPLVTAMETMDALKIKAHIEQDIAQNKLEIPHTSKYWEPYRAYEKRIVNASSKDKGKVKQSKKTVGGEPNEYVTTDEDDEGEVEGLVQPNGKSSQPQPQPAKKRPLPEYRIATPSERDPGTDNESRLTELSENREDQENGMGEDEGLRTPEPMETQDPIDTPSPARSRKRSRPPSDDEDEAAAPPSPGVETPDADEIVVRRKRVRH